MLAWCSIVVISTSSPGSARGRTKLCATRLMPSVPLRVNTISRASAALRKALTFSRASSCRSVARWLSVVHAAVDVGVVVAQHAGRASSITRLRLLRAGGRIQKDQRAAVDHLVEAGEVRAHRARRRGRRGRGAASVVHASSSELRAARQPAHQLAPGLGGDRGIGEALQHLVGEREGQHAARRGRVEAARAQVEQLALVELARGRAMRAFHVVGEDLELGLGVDLDVGRQQQIVVGLIGVGLLGVAPDHDLAGEHRVRLAVEHALVELVADAAGLGVVDAGWCCRHAGARGSDRGR